MNLKDGPVCTNCTVSRYISCVSRGRCRIVEVWIMKQQDMKAAEIAAACGVSKTIVYKVRAELNLDRLPTIEEVMKRNTKTGRPYKRRKIDS